MHASRLLLIFATIVAFSLLAFPAFAQEAPVEGDGGSGIAQGSAETGFDHPGDLATADQAYELKLRQLEEKVNQLKEKIFRSKSRLMLLQETILHGVIAGSKAVITHTNQMGGAYKLESVAYYLDGAPIFGKINLDGSLDSNEPIEIYNGTIQPGNHLMSAYLVYRGDSALFVYVEGIQVKLKSSYTFKAEEGKITRIDVIGYDKGGVTAKFEDRPAVKFDARFFDLQEEDLQQEEEETADEDF